LLNPQTKEFYFLEINPRLQVEHTISESICSTDIVKAQLRLAQGASFEEAGLIGISQDPLSPPQQHAIQLRLTAEDPHKGYSLSIGKIQSFRFPTGAGVRVDTALIAGAPAVVTSDFDSVIAKIIVTARTWSDVVKKARRAIDDTTVTGITTNLALLSAIVSHHDFETGNCDTRWLESNHEALLEQSRGLARDQDPFHGLVNQQALSGTGFTGATTASSTLFRKDDAWTVSLKPQGSKDAKIHHLQLTKVLRNDFPDSFAADMLYTSPGEQSVAYTMDLKSTSASGSATSAQHRQGSRSNPNHVIVPLSGKLVEVLVDVGDIIVKDQAVCVIKQMKMEVEIRSHKAGRVTWVTEAEDDEDVAEGILAAIVEDELTQAKL
jgi:pyruvate carboxylase